MNETYLGELLDELAPQFEPAGTWKEVLARARRGRRRSTALAAALVALVLVPGALAFGGKILDLFDGTPGPPQIRESFTRWNGAADDMSAFAAQQGFATKVPHADPGTAHGVIQLRTSDGPLDLWAATSDAGGVCWFLDWESDVTGAGPPTGGGSCDSDSRPTSNLTFAFGWTAAHPSLTTLVGRAYVQASSVRVALADGAVATLPVVEGLFLGAFDRGAKLASMTAYDAAGKQVAQMVVR